ncbi:MAG: class I SAM-dependent methyltransferase [Planctomycetota bacterium]|jgi:cyclopropane-fatty-acyl-phospholipid synthase
MKTLTLAPPRPKSLFRTLFLRGIDGLPIAFEDACGRFAGAPEIEATVTAHDLGFYRRLALGGHLAAAEDYIERRWDCDDLTALMRVFVRNRARMQDLEKGLARLVQPLRSAWAALRRNTRRGSQRNIAAHYDLGNDFFELFLDETMTYSCALFERPGMSLKEAQLAKIDRVCERLELGPDDHLLEIGTGWGGLALRAAQSTGCRVTTTTISQEQFALARARVREAGLEDRIDVQLRDYRDLEGAYDKLVSIEMIEAVGAEYYQQFFRTCDRLLKPGGRMLLQAITVPDSEFDACRREVDFIKRYVFPGSCIPSVKALLDAAKRASGLRLRRLDDLTADYAETLRRWRHNFLVNLERIRALGYPPRLLRMWMFYLCYCEAGFEERFTGDVHMLLSK